ncbi:unnamed protein product [Adineta steineri]|uniref:Uncharacterized protein n=1 Tax=Adineta steineri TaxID=433720 RepID=A0A819R798_9BILA|nr:unnamed protein product [Adineta steineri]
MNTLSHRLYYLLSGFLYPDNIFSDILNKLQPPPSSSTSIPPPTPVLNPKKAAKPPPPPPASTPTAWLDLNYLLNN